VLPLLLDIVLKIVLPILVLISLGVWMRRQFEVDLASLGKLNIYLFVPAFVYAKVSTSTLPWSDMGGVMLITIIHTVILGLAVWGLGRLLRVGRKTLAAVAIAVMFYNSGNYGLALAELSYPTSADPTKNGGAVQAFVVLIQNVLTFTVGLAIAAAAGAAKWTEIFGKIFRMPVLYMLAAAIVTRVWTGGDPTKLPAFIAKPAEYLAAGLVPVAMITMGAQLAASPRWPRWRPITFVLAMRLLYGPAQMIALLLLFHLIGWKLFDLWPWPAELLILTAAVPTAVNTLLLTLELEGDAELAADSVFWTTVFSTFTIAGWLVALRMWFGS
jgi:predicted permease